MAGPNPRIRGSSAGNGPAAPTDVGTDYAPAYSHRARRAQGHDRGGGAAPRHVECDERVNPTTAEAVRRAPRRGCEMPSRGALAPSRGPTVTRSPPRSIPGRASRWDIGHRRIAMYKPGRRERPRGCCTSHLNLRPRSQHSESAHRRLDCRPDLRRTRRHAARSGETIRRLAKGQAVELLHVSDPTGLHGTPRRGANVVLNLLVRCHQAPTVVDSNVGRSICAPIPCHCAPASAHQVESLVRRVPIRDAAQQRSHMIATGSAASTATVRMIAPNVDVKV
jgi:hypothetical protein